MKILSAAQIRELDQYTVKKEPVKSIDLMERAAEAFTRRFVLLFPEKPRVKILCGPGNNGGDGLAIARLLSKKHYPVSAWLLKDETDPSWSKDALANLKKLKKAHPKSIHLLEEKLPELRPDFVVIDALFGSGLSRPLKGMAAKVVSHINHSQAKVVAVDIPSGLYCDLPNDEKDAIVEADFTLTFQLPKLSFFFCSSNRYTGAWETLDIGLSADFIASNDTPNFQLTSAIAAPILRHRPHCSHKGMYGHALLWAGSYGKMGAAVMAARAALRSGAGLLTAYLPECGCEIMQAALPEAMVLTDKRKKYIGSAPELEKYSAIGIGPGLGVHDETASALGDLLKNNEHPIVIDADAINLIGSHPDLKKYIFKNTLLTPHPKEFERLIGKAKSGKSEAGSKMTDRERWEKAGDFAQKHNCVVVLKSAFTSIHMPDGRCYFNTNGNPGMAKGGSGDVLTGILTGLLAQGYSTEEAALMGVYLHGFAGDLALREKGVYSLLPTDLIESLPRAFAELIPTRKNSDV